METSVVRAVAWAVTGAACVGWAVVAGSGNGYPISAPRLSSGAAWLPTSATGGLTLLDGSTARVAAHVHVRVTSMVQHDHDAYVVDAVTGTVRHVDGATMRVGPAIAPLPGARKGLRVLATSTVVYAIDMVSGRVALLDPSSLATRRAPWTSAAGASTGAALDRDGRLWLFDAATGNLSVVTPSGETSEHREAARSGTGTLVPAGDRLVVADGFARKVTIFDHESGRVDRWVPLDPRAAGARAAIGGSSTATRLLVATDGKVSVCDLDRSSCTTPITLDGAGPSLGAPVEAAGRLFVPDYTGGDVFVVDPEDRTAVVARTKIPGGAARLTLIAKDGLVFFNDPMSDRAGVIRPDGTVRSIRKYAPPPPAAPGSTTAPSPIPVTPSAPAPTASPAWARPSPGGSPPTPGPSANAAGDVTARPRTPAPPGGPAPATTVPVIPTVAVTGGPQPDDASRDPRGRPPRPVPGAMFDYQIGGGYPPGPGIEVVSRDRADGAVIGLYNICYIDAFQVRRAENDWWQERHDDLLLRDRSGSRYLVDRPWGMPMLDVSTEEKRRALVGIVGEWIDRCAGNGFQAVEIDNMDSYERSDGQLSADSVVAYLELLIARAGEVDLAVAQTNALGLGKRVKEAGARFAIVEECGRYDECADYEAIYGDDLIDVEYQQAGLNAACDVSDGRFSVVLRDIDVSVPGSPAYVYRTCPPRSQGRPSVSWPLDPITWP
ncbi:sugar lactone lactonase YvrE [Catenuloplanes nepalensis]|uniref:Sugar lactone lactonase YvrE n=1 Tax=Catenuloplanes nepalensis TaxID=587533 RepID=A0ABT9MS25_9ACTN|nr:endo alpha-1,4 polygalactosaminidase [Catenuloplanes nepalensis]MDP9794242.1 sugar lactone lactonase YvrE [Catenuloplanes nepalensis]